MSAKQKGAMHGIVVCDFTWVGAGPISTNVLGQCGADVIKIESRTKPDVLRRTGPFKDRVSGLERSGYYANRNPNKRALSLNMSHPEGRDIAVALIKKSDIVINNFRVGQMEKWNLGWEQVREINPRAIYVTMSLQGVDGPHKSYMGYGVSLNALCGLTARAAVPGQPPFGTGTNYTDHVCVPTHTVFALMAALLQREVTGKGQAVAVSQLDAAIAMKPSDPIAYAVNGDILGPQGCRDEVGVPHGVYKTLGYRRWIAISVFGNGDWECLKRAMGRPNWMEEERFSTPEQRRANEDELDAHLEAWTECHYAEQLDETLQQHGVKAGKVLDGKDVTESQHLRERGFWCYLDHPEVGRTLYNRVPFRLSKTPVQMDKAAALVGQHTQEVITDVLGYSTEEYERMEKEGVLS